MVSVKQVAISAVMLALCAQAAEAGSVEKARWAREAAASSITRDTWGIAHIHGRTDADAVFAMIYAQAEDDFNRIETNYLTALGRHAEAEGEGAIWLDLRARLYEDDADLKTRYAQSPVWLKKLMVAWADGLNAYLAAHPGVTPKALRHFEPWMALSFTEGSIGGDIERVDLADIQAFYGQPGEPRVAEIKALDEEPRGSNGIAIAPKNTKDGHALLLINPHTSFYFRSEAKIQSDQGLNVYGASTWGQFFVYQGFNAHAGWMHTSSGVDAVDEFREKVEKRGSAYVYRYGQEWRPVASRKVDIAYRTPGGLAHRSFTVYSTHHGPVVRSENGAWISFAMMYKPVPALEQSYLRTKTANLAGFKKVALLQANSSNNTLFADDSGEIAYMHPHFIPRRDDRFDYRGVVDGADPATDWKGLHTYDEAPHVENPGSGFVYNSNNWPYTSAGPDSPKREAFARYMDTVGENPRGLHALRLLPGRRDLTLDGLLKAAYDPFLPAFDGLLPQLFAAYEAEPESSPLKAKLKEPIALLKTWDMRWSADSVPTALAALWGDQVWGKVADVAKADGDNAYFGISKDASPAQRLAALSEVIDRLNADYGDWRVPWGRINRYQRLTGDIVQPFSDEGVSIPIPFTSANWGSLASFGARRYPGTKNYYGTSGNSFVAVVEFGPKVRARAVSTGGESGDPKSPHFKDQEQRHAAGDLRPVYFYDADLKGHVERRYHPLLAPAP